MQFKCFNAFFSALFSVYSQMTNAHCRNKRINEPTTERKKTTTFFVEFMARARVRS